MWKGLGERMGLEDLLLGTFIHGEQIERVSSSSALVLLLSIILPPPLRPAGLRRILVPVTTPHSPSGL